MIPPSDAPSGPAGITGFSSRSMIGSATDQKIRPMPCPQAKSMEYHANLLCPVAIMGPHPDNAFPGWSILMIGWMGVLVAQFGWLANLVLPLALAAGAGLVRRPYLKIAIAAGLGAAGWAVGGSLV